MNAEAKLQCVADTQCQLGEAPLWHPEENKLYWVDILAGALFRYDPELALHEQLYAGDMIGGLALRADGSLLLFQEEGAVSSWRKGRVSSLLEPGQHQKECRFNDVTVSPTGEVLCGVIPWNRAAKGRLAKYRRGLRRLARRFLTKAPSPVGLYLLDASGRLIRLPGEVELANGTGFSPDLKRFYLTDSLRREIHVFDCSAGIDRLADRQVFAAVQADEGLPDGLAVDAEGFVWSARWGGGCVVRYDPQGKIERSIALPARNVTSLAFGGPDYRQLYITTAGGNDRARLGAGAGALFRTTPGIQGKPEFRARIGI